MLVLSCCDSFLDFERYIHATFTFQYALHVYETLMKAGKDYGIHNAGYYTIRHLRIEKLFAYWGTDMGPTTTPFESGREFRVNLEVSTTKILKYGTQ